MLNFTNSLLLMSALFNSGLAIVVGRGNLQKKSNLLFSAFLVALSLWAGALIGFQILSDLTLVLYYAKATYLAALLIATSFYFFSLYFPDGQPNRFYMLIALSVPLLYAIALFFDHDFLIRAVERQDGGHTVILDTIEYVLFVAIFLGLFVGALIRLWWKYLHAARPENSQLLAIAMSVTIAGVAGIYYNLYLASPYVADFSYLWTGPLFTTAIAITIMYSVFRLRLFDTKIIVTELLIGLLWIFTLLRTLLAAESMERLYNGALFVLAVLIGALLIHSVRREVEQREMIEKQERDLEIANRQQESLLHFISHEIKGYLTKNEAAFDAIRVGDYGPVSPELQAMSVSALADTRKGVSTVLDILDASNFKRGTVSYKKESFDLAYAIEKVVDDLRPTAQDKGLAFTYKKPVTGACTFSGDEEKLARHVFRNLIDNSIKYTPSGSVTADLARTDTAYRFTVTDTGVGVTAEDMKQLFTEGGHGKDSIKVNVHSTGYGLFIAKQVVEAHGGKIWAESNGAGKGSRFIVELPLIIK